jgi:hypothetical protein
MFHLYFVEMSMDSLSVTSMVDFSCPVILSRLTSRIVVRAIVEPWFQFGYYQSILLTDVLGSALWNRRIAMHIHVYP